MDFSGTLAEVFLITGRGAVLVIENLEGSVRVGDVLLIGKLEMVVRGIEMINARTPIPADKKSLGVLVDASHHTQSITLRGSRITLKA